MERIQEEYGSDEGTQFWLVLLDDGGPVQDARMAEWIIESDGTICSSWNRDLIIVAKRTDLLKVAASSLVANFLSTRMVV